MKKETRLSAKHGDDDRPNHEQNKRIKSERDRRLRKALSHSRYGDGGGVWER